MDNYKWKQYIGKRFGRYVVISKDESNQGGHKKCQKSTT